MSSPATALIALILIGGSLSSPEALALNWDELGPAERRVLLPYQDQWDGFDARTQERLRDGAARWANMDRAERADVRQRFGAWQAMDDEQRRSIRERYHRFRDLPPERQAVLRALHRRLQSLPPERRRALRERFESMSPAERRAFIDGARAGARNGDRQAHQLRQQIDPAMQAQFREMAADLSQTARSNLRRRIINATPAERQALLERLSELDRDQREALLTDGG